jgi:hypothetical protein
MIESLIKRIKMIHIAISINGIEIRLTDERWGHIVENHDDMAGYKEIVLNSISYPNEIREGNGGELYSITRLSKSDFLVVPYNEEDGFIITAFITDDKNWIERKALIWKR